MLVNELTKLAGVGVKDSLQRWHRSVNQMSGTFVLLRGKPEQVSVEHLDEWLSRIATMRDDMERIRKLIAPKKRAGSSDGRAAARRATQKVGGSKPSRSTSKRKL
jgi:hypothetical protein